MMAEPQVRIQVTYSAPERIVQWAITTVERYGKVPGPDHDRRIATLLSTHRQVRVVNVKIDDESAALTA